MQSTSSLKEVSHMPRSEEVARALELIAKRTANCDYFFSKLQSPDWIEPLNEAQIFNDPPDAVVSGTSISFPSWPEGEYLARMARLAPEKVATIIQRTTLNANTWVHYHLANAAASLPGALSRKWSSKECIWLASQHHLYFLLAGKPWQGLFAPRGLG